MLDIELHLLNICLAPTEVTRLELVRDVSNSLNPPTSKYLQQNLETHRPEIDTRDGCPTNYEKATQRIAREARSRNE